MVRLFAFGFAAGLPIMLVFSSLSFWLREAGLSRSAIGFFSWVTLAYAFKWVWAPMVDKLNLPWLQNQLGRRRSWLLAVQVAIIVSIIAMALTNPVDNLTQMALAAVAVAFFSATQDIIIDAFRIESGDERQQAAMAASYMIGYRIAMIVATAGVLYLAALFETNASYDYEAWRLSYLIMAGLMVTILFVTLTAPEPSPKTQAQPNSEAETNHALTLNTDSKISDTTKHVLKSIWGKFKNAFVDPVLDLIKRYKTHAFVLIILIATYRISDVVMGVMANVFYVDMGYTKQDIATYSKIFGTIMTLLGAFFAGGFINRFGILPILFIGGLLSALTNLLFVVLSKIGYSVEMLALVITVDNLSAGIATAALIAFLSSLTNREFTATQYAWLSSAMILLPKSVGGFSGVWVEQMGYTYFFSLTACLGIPAILSIIWLHKQKWHA